MSRISKDSGVAMHAREYSKRYRAKQAAKRRRQDREWAERSGPVTTRAMTDEEREHMRSRER